MSLIKIVGSSYHTEAERHPEEYYATDPQALQDFLWAFSERDGNELNTMIWEPACGEGNLAKVLQEYGHTILATDKVFRDYGCTYDFLDEKDPMKWPGDIITNPPYKNNMDMGFVKRALQVVPNGAWVIMLFKVQFLASRKRFDLFSQLPPRFVYIHSSRIKIWKNNENDGKSNALDYAWYVWKKGYQGETILRWIPGKEYRNNNK